MRKIILLLLLTTALISCGQNDARDGRVIELQEVSQGKFVVQDERNSDSDQSWVVVHYLNGSQKTIGLSEAEALMNQAPPSPANSPVFVNYDGGHNQGGITFSDLLLYHMMFNGFGGSYYHTQIVHRYPVYQTTIHRTVNVNYSSRYNQRWSRANFYRSSQANRSFDSRSVPNRSSFASRTTPVNKDGSTVANTKRTFGRSYNTSRPSQPSYSSSTSMSSRSSFGSSRPSYTPSRSSFGSSRPSQSSSFSRSSSSSSRSSFSSRRR